MTKKGFAQAYTRLYEVASEQGWMEGPEQDPESEQFVDPLARRVAKADVCEICQAPEMMGKDLMQCDTEYQDIASCGKW